jgi:hypothetical protein
MIPAIFCLTGIGLCVGKQYAWGVVSIVLSGLIWLLTN